MGHPSNVSRAVNIFRIAKQQKIRDLKRRLHACKDFSGPLLPFCTVPFCSAERVQVLGVRVRAFEGQPLKIFRKHESAPIALYDSASDSSWLRDT